MERPIVDKNNLKKGVNEFYEDEDWYNGKIATVTWGS